MQENATPYGVAFSFPYLHNKDAKSAPRRTHFFIYLSSYNPKQPQKYKINYSPTHRIDTIENTIYSSTKSGNTKCLKCV